jgi:serine protease Do
LQVTIEEDEMSSILKEVGATVGGLAARVGPAVVGLGRGWGRGSGVVVASGRVVATAHSLRDDEVTVVLGGGRVATARVAGIDAGANLAVLEVDTGDIAPVDWDPDAVEVEIGTPIVALANPGGRGLRATLGFVSSAQRGFRGGRGGGLAGIEHTAPLPRGSAGGPLVDLDGRLLGLNALRLDGGLILALAADSSMSARVDALSRGESVPRRRLGIAIAPPPVARRMRRAVGLPDRAGALVRAVEEGSAADRAGMARGDLIVAAAGRPLERLEDLYAAVDAPGSSSLVLTVVRALEERDVTVDLGPATEEEPR